MKAEHLNLTSKYVHALSMHDGRVGVPPAGEHSDGAVQRPVHLVPHIVIKIKSMHIINSGPTVKAAENVEEILVDHCTVSVSTRRGDYRDVDECPAIR
jgi:hypothetical protein